MGGSVELKARGPCSYLVSPCICLNLNLRADVRIYVKGGGGIDLLALLVGCTDKESTYTERVFIGDDITCHVT